MMYSRKIQMKLHLHKKKLEKIYTKLIMNFLYITSSLMFMIELTMTKKYRSVSKIKQIKIKQIKIKQIKIQPNLEKKKNLNQILKLKLNSKQLNNLNKKLNQLLKMNIKTIN